MTDVTQIISEIEQGDPDAAERLLPLVYDELRKLAAAKLAQEKPGQTLQATALVHEAYLRLIGPDDASRSTGTAADISLPRRPRRCGGFLWSRPGTRAGSSTAASGSGSISIRPVRYPSRRRWICWRWMRPCRNWRPTEPAKAELVKLRFFAGLTMPEAAAALGISLATAERHWTFARSWLYAEMAENRPPPTVKYL